MTVHQLEFYTVREIRELDRKPNREKARQILEHVAKQIQPILWRRKYSVKLLTEFYPTNRRLLGLNVGGGGGSTCEIRVRLRTAGRESEFLENEEVLGTMLHEITHNVVSPHNAKFYQLLDELTKECEELIIKGISGTGAGFDAPAAGKAGGRFEGGALPLYRLRELALKAAEGRLQKQTLMHSGPRTPGGNLSLRSLPPKEVAAAAAEHRVRDNLWCPTEALGNKAAAGADVDAALRAILDNAGAVQQQLLRRQEQQERKRLQRQLGPQQLKQQQGGAAAELPLGQAGAGVHPGAATPRVCLRDHMAQALGSRQAGADDGNGGGSAGLGAPGPAAGSTSGIASAAPLLFRASKALASPEAQRGEQRGAAAAPMEPGGSSRDAAMIAVTGAAAVQTQPVPKRKPTLTATAAEAEVEATLEDEDGVVDLTGLGNDEEGEQQQCSKRAGLPWVCPQCTLQNKPLALACEACLGIRPAGWQ